jgi:predicted acetyltransferase
MNWNLAVRDNGKLRALVGMYPDIVQVGDVTLKFGGIGAVSSHPRDRGKGWMKLLMDRQMEALQLEGYDLSWLVGQRQRYMYFGYEKAGVMLEYKLNQSNLKHFLVLKEPPSIQWEPLQATDLQCIEKAKALYDKQPVRCLRPLETFYLYMKTGYMQPWVAVDSDGNMAGYLISNPEHARIVELFADNETVLTGMIRAWFAQQNIKEATIVLPVWEQENAGYLGRMAEEVRVTDSGNWRICNWQKVVGALLHLKNAQHRLAEGTLIAGILGYGNLKLSIQDAMASCELTSEDADVEWDALTATRILFGPISPSLVTAIPKTVESFTFSWFPLPLGWLPQNDV